MRIRISKNFTQRLAPRILVGLGLAAAIGRSEGPHHALPFAPPQYILKLGLNEFSILNISAMDGLIRYGGSADMGLRIAKEANNLVWTLTITNTSLLDAFSIHVAQKTVKLIQTLDPLNPDTNSRIALHAIKSLTEKIDWAKENPHWELLTLSGYVVNDKNEWKIVSKNGIARIVGPRLDDLKGMTGRLIVANGHIKVSDQIEVTRFIEKRKNVLEVFVMSLCPFGQRAETLLFNFLARTNGFPKPEVEVHYIFYKKKEEGKDVFVSLHGEEEVTENLVQMTIRDRFRANLEAYLRLRSGNGHAPWPKLARQTGLTAENIAEIETTITTQRDALIQREYDYAAYRYAIYDGSPTFIWESERVPELKQIDAFNGIDSASHEACSQ